MLPRLLPVFIYFPAKARAGQGCFAMRKSQCQSLALGSGAPWQQGLFLKGIQLFLPRRAGLTFLLFFFYSLNTPFTLSSMKEAARQTVWSILHLPDSSSYGFPVLNKNPNNKTQEACKSLAFTRKAQTSSNLDVLLPATFSGLQRVRHWHT